MTTVGVSVCNVYDCNNCRHAEVGVCLGCRNGNQRLRESFQQTCAVYECVIERGIDSCKNCSQLVCSLRRSVESIRPLRSQFEKQRWWAGRMARALERRRLPMGSQDVEWRTSDRVVNRLRWYLTALDSFASEGYESISSWQLAERVGVSSALVRKDLSRVGAVGTPSFGYKIDSLREHIRSVLRLNSTKNIVWVGACAFRHAVGGIDRLAQHNCKIVGVFDVANNEIGTSIGEFAVLPADTIRDVLAGLDISAAVLAVSGHEAHKIAHVLTEMGVRAIMNLSGEILTLPDDVKVKSIDLMGELLELCYYC